MSGPEGKQCKTDEPTPRAAPSASTKGRIRAYASRPSARTAAADFSLDVEMPDEMLDLG